MRQLRAKSMPPVGCPAADAANLRDSSLVSRNRDSTKRPRRPTETRRSAEPASADAHRIQERRFATCSAWTICRRKWITRFCFPADNASSGFDNIADLLYVSPVVMERYLDTADKNQPAGSWRSLDAGDGEYPFAARSNSRRFRAVEELPIGTRGGIAVKSYFPLDAEYEIRLELAGGAREQHQLELTVDGERKGFVTIGGGGRGGRGGGAPTDFKCRDGRPTSGGYHLRAAHGSAGRRHAAGSPAQPRNAAGDQFALRSADPYNPTGSGDTPSRRRDFLVSSAERGRGDRPARNRFWRRLIPRRLPQAGDRCRCRRASCLFTNRARKGFKLRARNSDRARTAARQPAISLPDRERPGGRNARLRLSDKRSRTGFEAVFFPLEQRSG